MGRGKKRPSEPILDDLDAMFPADWLRETARTTGLIVREGVVNPVAMFWAIILGSGIHFRREVKMVRRSYEATPATEAPAPETAVSATTTGGEGTHLPRPPSESIRPSVERGPRGA